VLGPAQQQAQLDHATQVYAAVLNEQPDIAQKLQTERATALRNSGDEKGAAAADTFATMVKDHPEFAKTTMGLRLAATMGPDKFGATFKDIGTEQRAGELQPDAVRKGKADADAAESGAASAASKATTDAVTAKYADTKALLDLEGIKTDNEYKRQQTKIAYLNAQINRETNALKREELGLQVQKATQERDDKAREKVATAESAAAGVDNMLNTVDRILSNKSLGSVLGSIQGRVGAYLNDDAADAIAQIETLGSQAFIAQIPNMKGTGSLSEKEGDKLQASLQNLSRVQSEAQFKANLQEIKRIAGKTRDNISKRYGVALGNPDTPAAAPAPDSDKRPPLSSFYR
jgi:hypothetical protein